MSKYQIYCLDCGCRNAGPTEVEHATDDAAIAYANTLVPIGGQAEVWCSARYLGLTPPAVRTSRQMLRAKVGIRDDRLHGLHSRHRAGAPAKVDTGHAPSRPPRN